LASFYKVLEKLQIPHEKIVTIAGIGCSSRFPYFVNGHGLHFIHGRALPLATGISLSRPDLHVFAFGGDGDGFSIGGNHLDHAARKNANLTYIIMDNFVYGLTKKQTSPTSPIGFKSKTDPTGAIDQPINPMKKLVGGGASFVARSHAAQVKTMMAFSSRAILHPDFSRGRSSFECVVFYPRFVSRRNPKGGEFATIEEKQWDDTPEDEERHDTTDQDAAFHLASGQYPGKFGVYFEVDRPSKNQLEQKWIDDTQEKIGNASTKDLLSQRFASMK
ncbi:UNVERIFIED_CONTAM: hypothetical protein GTU68_040291, partial [Idotea baltica]|nr:hypothetical protein [Idotea baltica]